MLATFLLLGELVSTSCLSQAGEKATETQERERALLQETMWLAVPTCSSWGQTRSHGSQMLNGIVGKDHRECNRVC